MELVQETGLNCPYCGEPISIVVDGSVTEQQYIEDCQVCCRPMVICQRVSASGQPLVEARREDDVV